MASHMRTSRAGLDVIKAFEGFRPRYQKMPNGHWIIGYGHVRAEKEGAKVSDAEAEAILREYDLPPIERLVMDAVLAPLNQNEFDGLVSLAYNIGAKAFVASDIVAHINAGNRLAAASAFDGWRKAKIGGRVQVVDALVRRRAMEKALFLKPPGDTPMASSRLYRPIHDEPGRIEPPQSREILVERPPVAALSPPETETKDVRTATEEAAESVRRRLVRIIGEDGDQISEHAETTDGASPEEITAAISALAGDGETSGVERSVWPQRDDDLPPPPFSDVDAGEAEPRTRNVNEVDRIDDLEEVHVSQDAIDRAIDLNSQMEAEDNSAVHFSALPFGLFALMGAALAGLGLAGQFGLFGARDAYETGLSAYIPSFLMMLGGLLFVMMSYYFIRALIGRDE